MKPHILLSSLTRFAQTAAGILAHSSLQIFSRAVTFINSLHRFSVLLRSEDWLYYSTTLKYFLQSTNAWGWHWDWDVLTFTLQDVNVKDNVKMIVKKNCQTKPFLHHLSFLSSTLTKNIVLPILTELKKLLHNGDPGKCISKVYSVLNPKKGRNQT